MNRNLIIVLFFLVFISSVSADPKFIDMETKDNFTVKWYLERDGISKMRYYVTVENLENQKRDINLSSIFEPSNYPPGTIRNVGFYEYEEVPEDTNAGIPSYHIWSESKPIFITSGHAQRKDDYDQINIGKQETKIFMLDFTVPIIANQHFYGSSTKFYLGINNNTYHPWLNVSFFNRLYLYNLTNLTFDTVGEFTIDTRSLFLEGSLQENCNDIRVTDGDNTELEFNLVTGCLTQNTTLYIELPQNVTDLYIYFNNPNAGNVSNNTVSLAFNESSIILDLSGNNNNGDVNIVQYVPGKIGTGLHFNGSTILDMGIPYSLNITGTNISFGGSINASGQLVDKGTIINHMGGSATDGYRLEISQTTNIPACRVGNGSAIVISASSSLLPGVPTDVFCVKNETHLAIWVNGLLNATTSAIGNIVAYNGADKNLGVRTATDDEYNGSMDEIRIFSRDLNSSEISDLNNSIDINTDQLQLYYDFEIQGSVNITYLLDKQQYSPYFASQKTFEGIFNLDFPAPVGSSIYSIDIDLEDCGTNHFGINTDSFFFYGNITRITSPSIFGYSVSTPVKTWDVCLLDKLNITPTTRCEKFNDLMDFGSASFVYGATIRPWHSEEIITEYTAGRMAFIHIPRNFRHKLPDFPTTLSDTWYLAYPKELNFSSGCPDNKVLIRYQKDTSLEDQEQFLQEEQEGLIGLLTSLKDGIGGFIGIAWSIVTFGFSLLIFLLSHIWLVFILFEMFVMIYALKSTRTISEYMREFVNAHVRGLEITLDVLRFLFDFVLRIASILSNLIPFT
jgi:hypothetical protein